MSIEINQQTLQQIESSPEAQAVLSVLKEKAASMATADVIALIGPALAANPGADAATLEPIVEDQLWHNTRHKWGKLGFLVDILRNVSTVEDPVKAFVTAIVGAALATPQAPTS